MSSDINGNRPLTADDVKRLRKQINSPLLSRCLDRIEELQARNAALVATLKSVKDSISYIGGLDDALSTIDDALAAEGKAGV